MKEDYQKALKKLISFFLSNPVPFNGQSYLKQKGPGTSGQSLFRLQNKLRKIPLLLIYYLNKFDDIKQFLSYSKKLHLQFYASQFMTSIIPVLFDLLSLESMERKGKNTKM